MLTRAGFSGVAEMAEAEQVPAGPEAPRDPRPTLAAKANDLEALKRTVEDAASVSGGLWLSYLFVLVYIAVGAGAVTHADLLLESPVKLPFLGIELPLKAFFFLAPILFLISHAYTLAHFRLLADKAKRFDDQLYEQLAGEEDAKTREALRGQLPSNIFVQFLAGPRDLREGWFGILLKVIAWMTLVVGPILLLLLLQIQFLPYHEAWITWTHRVALLVDLVLVWWLWRSILSARDDFRRRRPWTTWAAPTLGVVSSFAAVMFSWNVATFPGEWQEDHFPSFGRLSLHDGLFVGDVDFNTRHRKSLFSNTLVLPGFNLYEALKIDDPRKVARDYVLYLRGRDLKGAIMNGASLPKVDFTGAQFQGGATLEYAHLEHSNFQGARLQGMRLTGAHLQGAGFGGAQLQGAWLDKAELTCGRLEGTEVVKCAWLHGALLQGALLKDAQLQRATLVQAQLQGASLEHARMQGAVLDGAQLQGASLRAAELQGALLENAPLQGASLGDWLREIENVDEATYQNALADTLGGLVCGDDNNDVHVVRGLLNNGRIEATGTKAPALVDRVLSKDCPVSARLTENDRAKLRKAAEKAAKK
jgi:uncharacterized protein YjbI with pentapeptide repeats